MPKVVNFLVVDNIDPKIILSIRSLKALEIDVIVRDDAVKCYGVVIPFVNPIPADKQVFAALNKENIQMTQILMIENQFV